MLARLDSGDLDVVMNAVDDVTWRDLAGKHLFLTGGTGFVGCWLLEALLHANARLGLGLRVTLLSRRPEAFAAKSRHLSCDPAVSMVRGDVRALDNVRIECDLVIHAATDVEKSDADPEQVFQAIVDGTRSVLALTARSGARRFLYVSSGAVYGSQSPSVDLIAEMSPMSPDDGTAGAAYGLGKRVSEWQVAQAGRKHGFDVVHARLFALVGPYLPLDAHFAAGNFIRDAIAGRPILINGNGAPVRSYLYGADMAAWLLVLLFKGAPGNAYNVGSETAVSILSLARMIAGLSGVDVLVQDKKKVVGLPPRYVPSTVKARSELGLCRYTELEDALARTISWARRVAISAHAKSS